MEERIKKRIDELTKARDEFVTEANQRIAAMNGAIGEMAALLAPEEPAAEEEPKASGAPA